MHVRVASVSALRKSMVLYQILLLCIVNQTNYSGALPNQRTANQLRQGLARTSDLNPPYHARYQAHVEFYGKKCSPTIGQPG